MDADTDADADADADAVPSRVPWACGLFCSVMDAREDKMRWCTIFAVVIAYCNAMGLSSVCWCGNTRIKSMLMENPLYTKVDR